MRHYLGILLFIVVPVLLGCIAGQMSVEHERRTKTTIEVKGKAAHWQDCAAYCERNNADYAGLMWAKPETEPFCMCAPRPI